MVKAFERKIEDFACDQCGRVVKGNGYTNHCPECLYSKHVDINPGDRLETCNGPMAPVEIESRKGNYILLHKCTRCGHLRKNRIDSSDNFEEVIRISKKSAEAKARS